MTTSTKAVGRPRLPPHKGKRWRKNQIVRAEQEQQRENQSVMIDARCTKFGLSEAEALDQRAGTAIGRYAMLGEKRAIDGISKAQYLAAETYHAQWRGFLRAMCAHEGPAGMVIGGHGHDGDLIDQDEIERDMRAVERFDEAEKVVLALPNGLAAAKALDIVICQNRESYTALGDLRIALNALVKHYRIEG